MVKPSVIVLRAAGTNCNVETVWALERVGATVEQVHVNELLQGKKTLQACHMLVIPGGFSYGDDVASGKILANQLRYRLGAALKEFVKEGKLVLGICNGFQVLVKCGLLPGFEAMDNEQLLTLTDNTSGKFECRWIYLQPASGACVFTREMPEVFALPVAHGEGRLVARTQAVLDRLHQKDMVVFRYVDEAGRTRRGYPANPNGSSEDIAAVCNPTGNVMGMMPHPERYIERIQHPHWQRLRLYEEGVGLMIFRNAVNYIQNNFL